MNDHGLVDDEGSLTFEKIARRLPDEIWNAFEPVLPAVVWCGNGRPPKSNRECFHGALYVLVSGIAWKLMPASFPCYKTVRKRFKRWLDVDAFRHVWAQCAAEYQSRRGVNLDQLSIDGARKPAKKGGSSTGPNPTDRSKCGTQLVLVATGDDLPVGVVVCGANRQDATFTGEALASVVIELPVERAVKSIVKEKGRRRDGKRSNAQLRDLQKQLHEGQDSRAMPYLRGDGNFAKIPARLAAKREGFRLWAPSVGQSRRGLGRIRSSVERAHALLNQFGRVFRRFDRRDKWYLAWAQLACCVIFMRQGFFP
jgi:putative transposase